MNNKRSSTVNTAAPKEKYFLAYYEVQVMGATLYLHTVVKARDGKEAGDKFFSQPTRKFGDVVLNPKGTVGGSVSIKAIPEKWATMLMEVGAGINSSKLKVKKPTAARVRALAAAGVTA